jgi:hypothetical protein
MGLIKEDPENIQLRAFLRQHPIPKTQSSTVHTAIYPIEITKAFIPCQR